MLDRVNFDSDELAPAPKTPDESESFWENRDGIPWERDLLTLFVRNQIRVAWAMPVLAALFAVVNMLWLPVTNVAIWLVAAAGCQAIQFYLCKDYLRGQGVGHSHGEWIGMLAASELMIASCWVTPLYSFWNNVGELQHFYLIFTIMAAIGVRIMIAANFMPIVIAGTGFMACSVAIRCILQNDPVYAAVGAVTLALEIFFIQVAVRLQETARDMLIFRAQKERLITRLKSEKRAAEQARRRAEDASRAKSQFLATMSHELRTPLNAIMGFSEILSREMMGPHGVPVYRTYADDIHNSGNYLLTLINDILDLSRIEAGRHDLREEPVSLRASIEKAVHVIDLRLRQKSQTLEIDVPDDLPKLMADERALHQIWLNLISNAIKFSPQKGVISISAERADSGRLFVTVKDTGPGIPKRELAMATGAFLRGAYAKRKAIDGAGLGLAIVKGLINLHGGDLKLRSKPGKGTEASVSFPIERVLGGPRGEVLGATTVGSRSQRRLIALTG
ncbi:HAMP domain-containing sensor histidine kinase [soil metagenome]